eukprot:XP_011675099.1 PREDICTED: LOW QUALITY PROTEIN: adenylate kinase 8-like [Strongylocentrotus purpuratus]
MVLYLFSHFLFFFIYQRLIEGLIISKSQDPLDYLLEQLKRENDDTPAIVIHGPPASGKTTIARLVSNQLKAAYTNKGTLLADDVSTTAAKARSCQSSGELFWKPPDTVLIERQTGKRIDPETGGLVEPPEGCREEAMVDRLILFHRFIPGLKVAYEQYTKSINADQPKADVYSQADDVSTAAAKARSCQSSGEPIPTELWVELIRNPVKLFDCIRKGWVLDGFPDTREQALALQEIGINPKHCLFWEAPDTVLMETRRARRIDPGVQGGRVFCFISKLLVYGVTTFLIPPKRSLEPHNPRIVLMCLTGSGKTVQAALLASKYGIINVSLSQLVKEAIASESNVGKVVKPYVERKMLGLL